jgi:hypothetical protein
VNERRLPGRRLAVDGLYIFAVWLVGAAVYFRDQWSSGFRLLMGNDGDTRLAAYLCEHWFQVIHGQASWLNPQFFDPTTGVLGWSDTFFLYQIFYAPLRWLGCDPFLALQITVILLSLVGFATFVYVVRLGFRTPLPAALVCGLIFIFSNALWIHEAQAQFSAIYFVPAVLLLGLLAWRAAGAGRRLRAAVLAGTAGVLWGLLFYTGYYVAWFSTLAMLVGVIFLLMMGGSGLIRRGAHEVRTGWTWMACGLAGLVLGLVPVARTYLPARHHLQYSQVMHFAGQVRDVVNVGSGNLVWSHLLRSVLMGRWRIYEVSYGLTPLVIALALGGAVTTGWLLWSRRRARPGVARLAVALTATAVVLAFLPIKTRFGSPWAAVWHIPGASAIRAIDRIEMVTGTVAVFAIAAAASELAVLLATWQRPRVWQTSALVLLALAAVEQVNVNSISDLNRVTQVTLIRSAEAPPTGCRTFFVVDSRARLAYFEYQLDAMLVSQKFSVPTINGYTGFFPPGWGLLDPSQPTYGAYVSAWVRAHDLGRGLCRLDLATMRWSYVQ